MERFTDCLVETVVVELPLETLQSFGMRRATGLVAETCSLLGRMQGKLVAERYADAQEYQASTRSLSWSMAKSVTSALIGIRIGQGKMSIDQLATSPIWSASEVASRNITGKHHCN